jgi:hypothetical protein
MVEHLGNRPVLNMDQLVEMTDLRPRLEKEMKLPGDARGRRTGSTSSRSTGRCAATASTGCLFAGECIMVQSEKGFEHALKLAKDGLNDTPRDRARVLRRAQPLGRGGEPAGQQPHAGRRRRAARGLQACPGSSLTSRPTRSSRR